MSLVEDLKKFILRGNVIDLAVAFVIGAAFQAVVTALVADLITPLVGIAGNFDFSSWQFQVGNATFHQGAFLNALLSFLVVAVTIFFLVVQPLAKLEARRKARAPKAAATTRECPECLSTIPLKARRCSQCTSLITPG